ncbi:MAG TPA: hypothetical protein VFR75_05290 [Solirubrobacterales bacterium]|nr:hypothetical protein [Solirubrobacterales bacterium]
MKQEIEADSDSGGDGPADSHKLAQPFVFDDRLAVDFLLRGTHKEFPRPATRLNRVIAFLTAWAPRQELTPAKVRLWLADSLAVFSRIVEDQGSLARIDRETAWLVTDEPPPDPDVWSGECKFANGRTPIVVCYGETLASRLPGAAFDVAWQGAIDHFVGHLYPYFAGAADESEYGEDVACRYQHLAAQLRAREDSRFRLVKWLLPVTYRLHKQIPLSNYQRLA